MGRLVGAYASIHAPLMVRNWDGPDADVRASIASSFAALGERIARALPDVLVIAAPDHWVNFFIDNYPTICIGAGEAHGTPSEPWMSGFPWKEIAGHPAFAEHLACTALAAGFEPSLSRRLELDHGMCIPLWKSGISELPTIVPLIVNCIEPPLPSFRRCYQWGEVVAQAATTYPGELRVAVLGTGGLSHSIGEPSMGAIDEAFDRACLQHFASGDVGALLAYLDVAAAHAGNGAAELRNWVVAHGAAGSRGFELLGSYHSVPQWYLGAGVAAWTVG